MSRSKRLVNTTRCSSPKANHLDMPGAAVAIFAELKLIGAEDDSYRYPHGFGVHDRRLHRFVRTGDLRSVPYRAYCSKCQTFAAPRQSRGNSHFGLAPVQAL
jgi:hypothetical protein